MGIVKASSMRKALVGVAVISMLTGATGPAAADGSGAGTFVGHEHAPDSELLDTGLLCARFMPDGQFGPLQHHLYTEGTFTTDTTDGDPAVVYAGTATADFTSTDDDYYANPLGTYSDPECTDEAAVPGTMTISDHIGLGTVDCSGDATFERRLTSVVEIILHEGSCTITDGLANSDTVDTTVTFTGVIEPCVPLSCPVVHPESGQPETAEALLEGVYTQS